MLISGITICFVAVHSIPLQMYIIFPVFVIAYLVTSVTTFGLLVAINTKNLELLRKWKLLLGLEILFTGRKSSFQHKIRKRQLLSLRCVSLRYGYLGTIKRETLTDYFYSLAENATNSILASA